MRTLNLETDVGSFATRYSQPSLERSNNHPRSLARAVEVAVDRVDANVLKPVAPTNASVAFQSRTLLALLTFCYARQVYSSTVIAAQLRSNLNSLRVNGDEMPDAPALLRFRCENRAPLSFCLGLALRFLAVEKIKQGFVTHVKQAHLAEEAGRRIVMAMFTDSMELGKLPMPDAPAELWFGVANEHGRMH